MSSLCFIVKNVSGRNVVLSDLNVELEPDAQLDLEKVVRKIDIGRSFDLMAALKKGLLKIIKRTKPQKVKVEKPLTSDEISFLIDKATREATEKAITSGQSLDITKLHESIQRQIASSINKELDGSLKDKIDSALQNNQIPQPSDDKIDALFKAINELKNSFSQGGDTTANSGSIPSVNIDDLARIAQKGIGSITEEMQQEQSSKKPKKIKLSTQANDLAKELD